MLKDRLKEPSTAAGGGLMALGLSDMMIDPATVQTGLDVVSMAAPVLLAPTPMGIMSLALGLFAMFRGEGAK